MRIFFFPQINVNLRNFTKQKNVLTRGNHEVSQSVESLENLFSVYWERKLFDKVNGRFLKIK